MIRRLLFALLLALLAGGAAAQEFDVFELSDFVDPRLRGGLFDGSGIRMVERGNTYDIARVFAGGVSKYEWLGTPSEKPVGFVRVTNSLYSGPAQVNVNFTALGARGDARIPRYRGNVQLALYRAQNVRLRKDAEDDQIVSRYLVTLAVEQYAARDPDNAPTALDGSRQYEFGSEMDVRLPLRRFDILGTVVYLNRRAEDGHRLQRLTYLYRLNELTFHKLRINAILGFGSERTDRWHWADFRPALRVSMPIEWLDGSVHVAYAPTISTSGGVRTVHETAIFIDHTFVSHLRKKRPSE
ncbi:MAG TPA: hypothetical protein VJ276_17185 [Thermoanaerobaculia bacterium]|nr:hypothetical protein [Thermoanaerobaculia bacterium]